MAIETLLTATGSVDPVFSACYKVLLEQLTVLQLSRKYFALILIHLGIFNTWFTHWVKNVPMLGLFSNNSQWYKEIILNTFFICSLKTPCHKIIIIQNNIFFSMLYFFKFDWTIFYTC